MQGHLASVGVVIHTPRDAPMVVAGPWKGVVIRVVTPTPGDNHKRFILHRHHAPCMTARPGAVSGHYGDLYSLPIHLGGFKGEWGVYCCTCKARAVSGHSEACARNAEKDGYRFIVYGGFTYARAANRNQVSGKFKVKGAAPTAPLRSLPPKQSRSHRWASAAGLCAVVNRSLT